ncbi:MAG: outer membrane protein assembly factor BamA, partial [Campylobacterota bacterium]|nr:outer membrane protein assembly factor BamA [Campylobacterota bacterium]
RELYLAPGDKYSLTNLNDSRGALGRTGYFESSTIEEKRLSESSMDLVVKVKEAATGNIQLGGGYGSYGGIMLNVGVNDRNVFGSGIDVGVKAEKSQRTMSASFNISNPRLNDSDFSGNFSIFTSEFEYNDYTVNSTGTGFGVGRRFTRYISGYMGYNYSDNSYSGYSATYLENPRYRRFLQNYDKSAVTTSITYDSTDDYYLPRKGWTASQSLEYAGVGGKAEFIKSRTTFGKYYGFKKLVGFDMIGRYKARYFQAFDEGFLPLAERFYMGGFGSVRGYESYSISPVIVESDGYQTRIGGKKTFSNNIEANFPFIPSAKMRLTTFFDWGFIGDDSLTEYSRGGYGLGLEWFSPMGPIQLIFARPLNNQAEDKLAFFEFTMGQRF